VVYLIPILHENDDNTSSRNGSEESNVDQNKLSMKTKFETVIGLYKGIIEDKATTDNSFPCHHVLYCIGRINVFKNFK
jgi:hypothetical protein